MLFVRFPIRRIGPDQTEDVVSGAGLNQKCARTEGTGALQILFVVEGAQDHDQRAVESSLAVQPFHYGQTPQYVAFSNPGRAHLVWEIPSDLHISQRL
jgi:hypothetical protein